VKDADIRIARRDAQRLIVFCDGIECAGLDDYASRSRVVARQSLALAEALDAERSARVALQARCLRQEEILGRRAYEAIR